MHIDTKHPGEPFKFSYVEVSFGIKNFFTEVETPNRNSELNSETVEENENSPDSNESETRDQEIEPSEIYEAEIEPSEVEDPEIELKRGLNDKYRKDDKQ